MKKQINYVIGRYWAGAEGPICSYAFLNTVIFFGSKSEARKALKKTKKENQQNK